MKKGGALRLKREAALVAIEELRFACWPTLDPSESWFKKARLDEDYRLYTVAKFERSKRQCQEKPDDATVRAIEEQERGGAAELLLAAAAAQAAAPPTPTPRRLHITSVGTTGVLEALGELHPLAAAHGEPTLLLHALLHTRPCVEPRSLPR